MTERSLVRKLSEVMAAVERVEKKGRNTHFNYDFVRETDLVAVVRPEFAKRQLLMTMSAQVESVKQTGNVMFVPYTVTIHDGESGEELSFTVLGAGQDTQDKGPYKALTGAVKYALMKLLLVDTGDDPENGQPATKSAPRRTRTEALPPESTNEGTMRGVIERITMTVDSQNTPPKWTVYHVHLNSGDRFSTFSKTIADEAKQCQGSQSLVEVTYKTTDRGRDLLAIRVIDDE